MAGGARPATPPPVAAPACAAARGDSCRPPLAAVAGGRQQRRASGWVSALRGWRVVGDGRPISLATGKRSSSSGATAEP